MAQAPGCVMRPKANFTDTDQSLWIAKFPAKDDERDIGAWESLAHGLAQRTGIEVPPARTKTFGGEFHTFCVKRFDRIGNRRRFYASAMAMLGRESILAWLCTLSSVKPDTSIADRAGQFLRALASRRSNWYRLGFPNASFLKSACWGLSR
jgi:hypothetical protein